MESRSSILRISDTKTLELIELYEEEECLWNTELPNYRNRANRYAAADRIAKKLAVEKFDARHVIIKFKNLRNSYCQELKKVATSIALGENPVYRPRVFWFPKMDSFLRPHLQQLHPWDYDIMSNQRWSADKNIQFIKQYRRNPCLWDPKHPKYKNRSAREVAYRSIMVAMGMGTVKDVTGKIRILRNTYNNETLKTKKSKGDEVYVSKIPWLSYLDFIKDLDTKESEENLQQKEDKDEIFLDEPPVEFVQLTNPEDVVMVKTEPNDDEDSKPPKKRPKSKFFNDDSDNSSGCGYSHAEARIRYTQPRDDCFDTFGKYVSSMLRMMPKQKAMELQPKIVTLLTSVDFDSIEEHVSQSDETS